VAVGPTAEILAVIVAVWVDSVGEVAQEKLTEVAPAATVIVAGTPLTSAVLLFVSVTTKPPAGAGALMVMVPVELVPPVRDGLLKVKAVTWVGVIVRFAVFAEAPTVAVVLAAWPVKAEVVVTV